MFFFFLLAEKILHIFVVDLEVAEVILEALFETTVYDMISAEICQSSIL